MEKLFVFADFDWMKSPIYVGELNYEFIHGTESFSFKFDDVWLKQYGNIFLSNDLHNYPGVQYTLPGRGLFGCFSDALPDRWGRTLLNRREQLLANEENRAVRRLSSYDYLLGIDDFSRMGAFRFQKDKNGNFINTEEKFKIPPLTGLRDLIYASNEIEKREEADLLPEKKWLMQLVNPGSSLGGARPKSTVVDLNQVLYVAKFPSRRDVYDVGLWEHFCHLLAKKAGINCAATKIVAKEGKYHTLLSRRFDRNDEGKRIHFASAMALLGFSDGDGAQNGLGYLDIVDFIIRCCTDVESNLKELYRRVAFNICVGNSDDHFRNHGFLLTQKGWTLAPAYDLNPSVNEYQSLLISRNSNKSDLHILLAACDDYMLSKDDALNIVVEVTNTVKKWQEVADIIKVGKRESDMFGKIFAERCQI